jgi:MFS family permease
MLLQLLFLAIESALYPTLLAAVVILLAQPRPRALLGAYLAGGLVVSIVAGSLIVYGLQHSGALKSSGSGLSWGADLAIGGLALLLAVALAERADVRFKNRREARHANKRAEPAAKEEPKEPWSQRILTRGSVPIVFVAGLAINVPGAVYLVGLKDIAAAHKPAGTAFLLILGFNAIMFLLAEVPMAGLIFAPERTDALVTRFNAWLSRNGRRIAIGVCATVGVFLVVRGIVHS